MAGFGILALGVSGEGTHAIATPEILGAALKSSRSTHTI